MGKLIYVKKGEDRVKSYKLDESIANKYREEHVKKEKAYEKEKKEEYKSYDKFVKKKMSYKSGNPLKKLLKVDRPTVKVSGTKERINLMRGTW